MNRWMVAAALAGMAGPGAAAAPAAVMVFAATADSAAATPLFWDSFLAAQSLLRWQPDLARVRADSILALDPDDFLGRWLQGAQLARDSSAAGTLLEAAEARSEEAGVQVAAGVILLARDRVPDGFAALTRAGRAYGARGRLADESRAALWKFKHGWDRGNAAPFMAELAVAESLARRAADPAALADVLILKGGQATRSDNALARACFQEAHELLAPFGDASRQLTGAHRGLGLALNRAGDPGGASRHYRRAFDLAVAQRDSFQAFSALGGLGWVQMGQEDYPGALETLSRAQSLAIAIGEARTISRSQHDMGTLHMQMGDHVKALESYRTALETMEDAGLDTDNKPVTMVNLGALEAILGDYDAGRIMLERALAICRRRNIRLTTVDALYRLARIQRELGDPVEAGKLSREALDLCRDAGYHQKLSSIHVEHARALNALNEPREALASALEGMQAAREYEPRDLWHLVLDQAVALHALGRREESIAALDSVLAESSATPDSSHLEQLLLLKGDLLLRTGQVQAALTPLQESLRIALAMGTPGRIADARLTLGRALLESGRPQQAAAMLEEGLAWFESVQSAVRASAERSAYQARWHDSYVSLARAYAASSRNAMAFATLERSRARELRRVFAAGASSFGRVPAQLARRLDAVESRLAMLQASLLHQYAQPAAERPKGLGRLESRVDSLRSEWEKLNNRLQREAPGYAREAGLTPASRVGDLQKALRAGERLLAFMVGRDVTLVFDVQPGSLIVREIAKGEDDLAREVETVNRGLRGEADAADGGAKLAALLLGPSRLPLQPPAILYVVPDAALHHLPFEALRVGEGSGRGRYLVEWSQVVYAGSSTLLLHPPGSPHRRANREPTVVALGDPALGAGTPARRSPAMRGEVQGFPPLPYARREVQELSSRFPRARVYVGAEASESRFYAEAPGASIIHLAAHAFVDERHPGFSGIALAGGAPGDSIVAEADGLLQAFEIMGHDFDLDLVVLSACESGHGRLERGEGLIGLARAFRLAGARNLIVSLWKVDDAATAGFMSEFYARLSAGAAPAAALRGAKLALITRGAGVRAEPAAISEARGVGVHPATERQAGPAAWAAFVLLGTKP
jgi:CHAT domain-containing protein/tetratricopeptide (TPR) repeat protein